MTLIILLVLIVIASAFALLNWRVAGFSIYGIATLLFLGVSCGPIPVWLLTSLQGRYDVKPDDAWGKRNVVVLLGSGTSRVSGNSIEPGMFAYGRIVEAVSRYRACLASGNACHILVSGGDPQRHGAPEALVYRQTLVDIGVEPDAILTEPRSLNTWQNAQFSAALLKDFGADHVLLVSSATHLQRSELYFRHFDVHGTAVRGGYMQARPGWMPKSFNLAVNEVAFHEYIGIWRYYLYNRMRWNPERTRGGQA